MRLRGVRLKGVQIGKEIVPDLTLDFRDSNSKVGDVIGLYGGAGSYKNFILRAIYEGWRRSIVRHNITQSIWNSKISGEIYIDFEIGKELATVKIINGEVIHSPAIYRLSSIDIKGKKHAEDCVLMYDQRLSSSIQSLGIMEVELGLEVGHLRAVLSDVHLRQMGGCILLIEDFDAFLSEGEARSVCSSLVPLIKARDSQLLFSSPNSYLRTLVDTNLWYEVWGKEYDRYLVGAVRGGS